MSANTSLTGAQLIQLASDFNAMAGTARDVLTDATIELTADQSNLLSADVIQLGNIAANLATWAALLIFEDSDKAFQTVQSSTQSGAARLAQLKADAKKVNAIISVLGAAVSLGLTFGSGGVLGIISAAGNLATAAGQV